MSLQLTVLDVFVCVPVFLSTILLGLYLGMRKKAGENSENFFLAGRSITWPVIGGSLFATNIGAEHLVGMSGDCYRYGLCAGTIEVCALCLGVAAAFIFPFYLKQKVFTIPEFLELRYNRGARLFFAAFTIFVSIMMKLALCLFAGALVLQSVLGLDVMMTVLLIGMVAAVITILGGFAAVAYTDTLQTIVMIVGCTVMLFIGLHQVGGWSALVSRAPEAMSIYGPYDHPDFPFWGIVAASFYAGIFYWGVDQNNVQRVLGAKDLHHARWGVMLAILLKLSVIFIFAVPGVIAFVLYPGGEPKLAFVTMLNNLLPSGLRGLVLASLVCALISSLDSVLNSTSTVVVKDFVLLLRPGTSQRAQVFIGRLTIVVCTLLGTGAAYLVLKNEGGVYRYFQSLGASVFMACTPAIVFGIMSRRVTIRGALISVITGLAISSLFLADEWMAPESRVKAFPWLHMTFTSAYSYRGLWGFLVVTAVLFGASAVTKKDPPEKLENNTVDWSKKWDPFEGWSDWRVHFAVLTVLTILVYAFLW